MTPDRIVLASSSPRRRQLLAAAGFDFDVEPADIDESLRRGEDAATYVQRLAREKAQAVAARISDRPILGADTVVALDGDTLGKPANGDEARHMLRRLSGRAHSVLTGVALEWRERREVRVERTMVWMVEISEAEIAWYVESGEPMDKAGAYAVQGRASRFIKRIEGSYTNVVGLPVAAVTQLLRDAGLL